MEPEQPKQVSLKRIQHLFLHLAKKQREIDYFQQRKTEVKTQVEKVRHLTKIGAEPEQFENALARLEKRISEMLAQEINLHKEDSELIQHLQKKIDEVVLPPQIKPFEDFEKISAQIQKAKVQPAKNPKLDEIEKKLLELEKTYSELKNQKYSDDELKRIKELLEKQKSLLKEKKEKTKA